ncbi:MAG: exonuclease subunit SbcD [bacterium]
MITIYHTADLHFGIENYGKIDQKTGIHSRLLDFKESLDECINQAIKEQIDLFLLCGDAYKSAYPTPTQQKLLIQSLLKLHKAGIPVVIIIGNHDHPLSFGKANALDILDYFPLDTFYVFSKPDSITITTKNGPIQIVGVPWPTRSTLITHDQHHFKDHKDIANYLSEKVGQLIQAFADKLNPNLPAILAGHLTVSSGVFSGSEKTAIFGTDPVFLPSQLALSPFDYVALGHLHRYQNLNTNGTIPLIYSGSLERIDFGERKEEKGYCKIQISTDKTEKTCTHEFVPVKTRPMVQFDITLEANINQTDQIINSIKKQDITGAIIKITYHIPENSKDTVDLYAIGQACKNAHYIASIIPVYKIAHKQKRTELKIDMNFKTLLSTYFDSKKELSDEKKGLLIQKAFNLYEKHEKDQTPD